MKEDGSYECEAERILLEKGYEGTMFLTGFSYDDALVGVTTDRRAVYDYDRMVEWLINEEGFEDDVEAMEWIDYNTLRAVPYFGSKGARQSFRHPRPRKAIRPCLRCSPQCGMRS